MKIVALDGYCLNPGDLSWDAFRRFGEVELFERSAPEEVPPRLAGASIALINKTPLRADVLRQAADLRYIGVLATGYDVVDIATARELGIVVTNIPTYGTASVAQFVFALLLELCLNVKLHSDAVRAGEWARCPDWSFAKTPLVELANSYCNRTKCGQSNQAARCAESEPALASFLYTVVLSHRRLEDALSYILASKLGSTTVNALTLRDLMDAVFASDPTVCAAILGDLQAVVTRDPACRGYSVPLLYFKGFHALQAYRVAHYYWVNDRQPLALYLQSRIRRSSPSTSTRARGSARASCSTTRPAS